MCALPDLLLIVVVVGVPLSPSFLTLTARHSSPKALDIALGSFCLVSCLLVRRRFIRQHYNYLSTSYGGWTKSCRVHRSPIDADWRFIGIQLSSLGNLYRWCGFLFPGVSCCR